MAAKRTSPSQTVKSAFMVSTAAMICFVSGLPACAGHQLKSYMPSSAALYQNSVPPTSHCTANERCGAQAYIHTYIHTYIHIHIHVREGRRGTREAPSKPGEEERPKTSTGE